LFEALNEQIARTPASELKVTRISVPTVKKLLILLRVLLGGLPR
jgi:hypothetical protein